MIKIFNRFNDSFNFFLNNVQSQLKGRKNHSQVSSPPKSSQCLPEDPCLSLLKGACGSMGSVAATLHIDTLQQWKVTKAAQGAPPPKVNFTAQFFATVPNKMVAGAVLLSAQSALEHRLSICIQNPSERLAASWMVATIAEKALSQPLSNIVFQIRAGKVKTLGEGAIFLFKQQGLKGFYRSYCLITMQSAAYNAFVFPAVNGVINGIKKRYPHLPFYQEIVLNAGLGAASSVAILPATYPLFRISCAQKEGCQDSIFEIFRRLRAEHCVYKAMGDSVKRQAFAAAGGFGAMNLASLLFDKGQKSTELKSFLLHFSTHLETIPEEQGGDVSAEPQPTPHLDDYLRCFAYHLTTI